MPSCKLYDLFTWRLELPEPFNDPSIPSKSTEHVSAYANAGVSEAVLHSSALDAFLSYYEVTEKGAKEES